MRPWVEVYTRCMDGEYFRGEYCPLDGFSSDTSAWIVRAVQSARREGALLSMSELQRRGFDGDWADVVVIEFASQDLAPDLLRPVGP